MIIVYSTFPDKKTAKNIVSQLFENKLIKCANIVDSESLYLWKEKNEPKDSLRNDNEAVVIMKAKEENFEIIKKRILELHPYDIPCVLKLDVEANEEYDKWVSE